MFKAILGNVLVAWKRGHWNNKDIHFSIGDIVSSFDL